MTYRLLCKGLLCLTLILCFKVSYADIAEDYKKYTMGWIGNDLIEAYVKLSNDKYSYISFEMIEQLDKKWLKEVQNHTKGGLVDDIMQNELSKFLKEVKYSYNGKITEILVMNNKGLNVGLSDITSDFWQGDESKFINTYVKNTDEIYQSPLEFDESTQNYQTQLSKILRDKNGEVIGVVTIGVR